VVLERLLTLPQGMTIGRAADQCQLVVAHATISRRHARLSLAGEALQIEDLGSTNGTAVGGKALKPGAPVLLQSGASCGLVTSSCTYGKADPGANWLIHCRASACVAPLAASDQHVRRQ
jgi:hypothetical protein